MFINFSRQEVITPFGAKSRVNPDLLAWIEIKHITKERKPTWFQIDKLKPFEVELYEKGSLYSIIGYSDIKARFDDRAFLFIKGNKTDCEKYLKKLNSKNFWQNFWNVFLVVSVPVIGAVATFVLQKLWP